MQLFAMLGREAPVAQYHETPVGEETANYHQGIRSYQPEDKACPVHGHHRAWIPTESPFSWKTATDIWGNESALESAAQRGSVFEETKGFAAMRDLYAKAIRNPKTKDYLKHMYITCHPVKNQQ